MLCWRGVDLSEGGQCSKNVTLHSFRPIIIDFSFWKMIVFPVIGYPIIIYIGFWKINVIPLICYSNIFVTNSFPLFCLVHICYVNNNKEMISPHRMDNLTSPPTLIILRWVAKLRMGLPDTLCDWMMCNSKHVRPISFECMKMKLFLVTHMVCACNVHNSLLHPAKFQTL